MRCKLLCSSTAMLVTSLFLAACGTSTGAQAPTTQPDAATPVAQATAAPAATRAVEATPFPTALRTPVAVAKTATPAPAEPLPVGTDESRFASYIPDTKIPKGLFAPDKGTSNFDTIGGNALDTKGDWILYADTMESILPVPLGWTTRETGQDTYILYSPTGDLEQPAIRIRLSTQGYDTDATTSSDIVETFLQSASSEPRFSLVAKGIEDADKGYVVGDITTESGKPRRLLQVFSKYARNPSGKFFHVFSVYTDDKDWEAYYPIIQTMVNNWRALDETPIGLALPDKVGQ